MNWSLKAKEKGKLRSDPQHPPHGRVESSLFPHRSQHGECLHVPSRGRGRSGSPPGPSRAHHQPSLLILPACCYPGLPGRWARPLPAPTRPLLSGAGPSSCHTSFLAECGLPGPTEPASHLPASTVQHHGLRGESVGVHGLPALRHAESHDHPPQPRCASAAPAAALPLGAAAPVSAGELSQGCCREEWTVRARRTQAYTPMAAQPHIYLQAQLHRWWGTPGVSPTPGQEEGGEHAKLGGGLHEARAQPRLGLMGYTRRQGQAGVC